MTAAKKTIETVKGTGSYGAPYKRKDGQAMVKFGLSVPIEFMQRIRAYAGSHLPLNVTISEWVVQTLDDAMKREMTHARSKP